MGAAFTVEFEKARHLSGDDARNLEASLARDQQDTAPVRAIQAQAGRIGSAQSIATLASINEIIGSLTRATLCRNLKKALQAIPAGVRVDLARLRRASAELQHNVRLPLQCIYSHQGGPVREPPDSRKSACLAARNCIRQSTSTAHAAPVSNFVTRYTA